MIKFRIGILAFLLLALLVTIILPISLVTVTRDEVRTYETFKPIFVPLIDEQHHTQAYTIKPPGHRYDEYIITAEAWSVKEYINYSKLILNYVLALIVSALIQMLFIFFRKSAK